MGHTTVRSTVSTPVYIAYRCSKCNHLNAYVTYLSETRETAKLGTVHLESTERKMMKTAEQYSVEALGRRIRKVLDEEKQGIYRAAEFNCPCARCGHKEAWSKLRYTKVEEFLGRPLAVAIFCAVIGLIDKRFVSITYISCGFFAVIGLWYLFKHFHRKHMEQKIEILPKSSLPIIAISEEELRSKVGVLPKQTTEQP